MQVKLIWYQNNAVLDWAKVIPGVIMFISSNNPSSPPTLYNSMEIISIDTSFSRISKHLIWKTSNIMV